ncbi:MAG TPA: (2Fe-2S)-binding protein [Gammaproteobacteria bacterium]|nr:(2Fe-2S)-binding protein [Gammaproteobacteria bacterium]
MYICLCKGVTDHKIRALVADGARSWREVREVTGCGTQCGKCACSAKTITQKAIKDTLVASAENLAYAI